MCELLLKKGGEKLPKNEVKQGLKNIVSDRDVWW
jgi:hypothetical protein